MGVYLFFLVVLLLLWNIKFARKQGIVFLGILLIMILSLRSIDLGYTDTKAIYYEAFVKLGKSSFVEAIQNPHFRKEPLMAVYIFIFAKLFGSFRLFIITTSIISIIPIVMTLKNEKYGYFGMIFYFSFYFFYSTYLLKQMLAVAVVIPAFNAARNKKLRKFVILVGIASLIHKFAWPCFIAYPLCNYIRFKKRIYIFIGILITSGLIFSDQLINLIIRLDPTRLMKSYIHLYGRDTGFNFGILINILILLFCAIMRKKIDRDRDDYNKLLVLSSLNCILNSYSIIITEFQRLAIFFGIYNMIVFPRAVSALPIKKNAKRLTFLTIAFFIILYGLMRTAVNTHCVPYKFLKI